MEGEYSKRVRGEKGEYMSGAVLEVHTGHIVPGLSGASVFNLTSKLHQLTLHTMPKVPTGENSGVGFFFLSLTRGLGASRLNEREHLS
jgi:hypothetical protein